MSFSNNVRPDRMPGIITGNPLNGLSEKVCIQVHKVFDACIKQETAYNQTIALTSTVPPLVTEPFTFISLRSVGSTGVVSNLVVERLPDRAGLSRVTMDISIPVEILFTDNAGVNARGYGTMTVSRDIILRIPEASVISYQIEAIVNAVSADGVYTAPASFTVTVCLTTIIKVVIPVELLVPSYGYCFIPPCQEYEQEVCEGFFDLPIFPT